MYKKPLPSADRLHFLLSYDPHTGELRWKNAPHHTCAKGVICPGVGSHGYKMVTVDRVTYLQHRIVWVMQTGAPPPDDLAIDHIDENPGNNRWNNLRLLPNSENVSRSSKHVRAPVVIPHKNGGWQVWKDKRYIGRFASEEDAREADPAKTIDRRRNDTPVVRVRRSKSKSGWEARVYINGRRIHLGTFPTREQALCADIQKILASKNQS